MAFESLKGEVNTKFDNKGDKVDGVYVDTKVNQGKDGNSAVHSIRKDDGSMANFWGTSALDDMISKCKPGDYIRVEYQGLAKSKNNREYHTWEVFKDAERSEVMTASAPTTTQEPMQSQEPVNSGEGIALGTIADVVNS
jgi:hypothetical protein